MEHIPIELFKLITDSLSCSDLLSLARVSRSLSKRSIPILLRHPTLRNDRSSFTSFLHRVVDPHVAFYVQSLHILDNSSRNALRQLGFTYEPDEENEQELLDLAQGEAAPPSCISDLSQPQASLEVNISLRMSSAVNPCDLFICCVILLCPNMKSLSLPHMLQGAWDYMATIIDQQKYGVLEKLERLILRECIPYGNGLAPTLLEGLPSLKHLEVSGARKTDFNGKIIAGRARNINFLHVSGCSVKIWQNYSKGILACNKLQDLRVRHMSGDA